MKSHFAPVVAAVVAVALLGCSSETSMDDTAQTAASLVPTVTPRATIVSPVEGDTVAAAEVKVTLGVEGVKLVPVTTPPTRVEGEGHLHLLVDRDLPMADAPLPVEEGVVHLGTGASEHTFTNLAPGPHRVIVVFAYGDHVPAGGVSTDTVNVVVK